MPTCFRIVEVFHELQTLFQSGEDCELPVEWVSSEEQIEHGVVVDFARLPVGVGHRDLVEVWNGHAYEKKKKT